ncbi:MAG: HD domain-containing protein [Proteobacteria bacterium]|nr:HD domain-containing protein [Pseudomonadota bacterium]
MLNIHRLLLQRLLASWVLISLAVGGTVYYFGIEKIDDQLVDIVSAESAHISETHISIINDPVVDLPALGKMTDGVMRENFVVVEIYNRSGEKLLERVNPRFETIEQHLKQYTHVFPRDGGVKYDRFQVDGQNVLQALVPIKDHAGATAGFLEGVFIIDPEILARLRQDLAVTLLIALCTVLVTTLVLYPVIISLNRNVIKFTRDLLKGNIELMEVLGSAIAKRDSDTNIHNYRVSIYAVRLAEAAGLSKEQILNLIAGAFLHDVGKIGISDSILLKPAKLSEEEFAVMKTHVTLGVDILTKSNWLQSARDVVEFHHEKFNGKGYMRGYKGEEIPINARVFAIVDVFDALTSKRPYKEPMPFDEAMAILRRDSGSHFDPRLIVAFEGIVEPLYRQISAAPDEVVEKKLQALIERYFFADKAV